MRYYYNIELAVGRVLQEEDCTELEEVIRLAVQERNARVSIEYVDNEG